MTQLGSLTQPSYVVTAAEIQAMDRLTIDTLGLPGTVLMEAAGRGAADMLLKRFATDIHKGVGVVAGKGNNGGDGYVVARYLAGRGIPVSVFLLGDHRSLRGDAAVNFGLLSALNVPVYEIPDRQALKKHRTDMHMVPIWVDAILGTGLKSEVRGLFREVIALLNDTQQPIFALDIPSGLNSDDGQPCGICIKAQATATFGYPKIGHLIYPGAAYTGDLDIVDIGIPPQIARQVDPKQCRITPEQLQTFLHLRPPDAHKGLAGHLLVVAGSTGKTGAAAMTAMSALRAGAGLVTLGIPQSLNPVLETLMLEAMTAALPESTSGILGESALKAILELIPGKQCLALGPGLGQSPQTRKLIHRLIKHSDIPLVVDADGLNNLAGHTQILKQAKSPIIVTPHPGEMARLSEGTAASVQKDRIRCARTFAQNFQLHVVLKGARTVVAHPDGRVFINPTGNAGMATGGMGDILTGIIAGLIAQGLEPAAACHAGVYLHGAAADSLAQTIGPIGFLASEVMQAIPGEINAIINPPKG